MKAFVILLFFGILVGCSKPNAEENKIKKTKKAMTSAAKTFKAAGLLPPKTGYQEFTNTKPDPWGSFIRLEYINGKPALHSAGPDKTFDTKDDLIVEY